MYKQTLLCLVSFLCFTQAKAQSSFIDSLKNEISDANQDSVKGRLCMQIGLEKSLSDSIKLNFLSQGIEYAVKSKNRILEAKGRYHLGYVLRYSGKLDSAYHHLVIADELFTEGKDERYTALNSLEMAANRSMAGKLDEAVELQKKSVELHKKIKDTVGIARSYTMLVSSYARSGKYEEAFKYAVESLKYAEQTGDNKTIGGVYTNLTGIAMLTDKQDEALKYALKGLEYWQQTDEKQGISNTLENIGSIHNNLKRPKLALDYYRQAYEVLKDGNYMYDMIFINSHLAQAYRGLKNYDSSFYHFKEAQKICENIEYIEPLGNLYFEIGYTENLRGRHKFAIPYLKKGEEFALAAGVLQDQRLIYDALADSYAKLGDYKTAYFYNDKFLQIKDSLLNIESEAAMAEMKTKYDTEKKDLQIDVLQKQAEIDKRKSARQRMLIFGSLLLALLAGTVGYLRIRQNKLNQRLKMERFRNKVAADLHDDVGSTLSSISMYSEVIKQKAKDKLPETLPMLENMSTSSKELMDAMSDIVWTINPKNNSIGSLLSRIKLNTAELCEAKEILFEYQGNNFENVKVEMDVAQNVYLVLKEAINNALKYSECSKLLLKTNMQEKSLTFSVIDDGKGFDAESSTQGNGMRTMKDRMQEIGGTLTVQSGDPGAEIHGMVKV